MSAKYGRKKNKKKFPAGNPISSSTKNPSIQVYRLFGCTTDSYFDPTRHTAEIFERIMFFL